MKNLIEDLLGVASLFTLLYFGLLLAGYTQ